MRRTRGMLGIALLASSVGVVVACGSRDSSGSGANGGGDSTTASDSALPSTSSADVIDVSSGSHISLALRGGLGPILSGQTITKAVVSMSDLELVDASGASAVLSSAPFTGDLVELQDQLGQIFSQQSIQAGRYTALRFRLRSAAIEAQDAQGAATVYASQGADTSQFSKVGSVQTLQLAGLDPNGFVTCALPTGGIAVSGASSLALQFALAQSLVVQSDGTWVLTPRCWLVDQSTFSSLDVDYEMSSSASSYEQYWSSGFQVMLLDSNLYPICEVPIAVYQSATFRAHFVYLQSFEGPFVAVLVPPTGYALQSTVAFSVDVQQGTLCSASISVTSFEVVSGQSFAIGTGNECRVVQRDPRGNVLAQSNEAIGAVEDVAPTTHHRQPVSSGEEAPPPAEVPQLPGNPPPKMGHRHGGQMGMPSPTGTEQGVMPPAPTSSSTEPGMMPPTPTSSGPTSAPGAPKGPRGGPPPSPPSGNPNPPPSSGPSQPPTPAQPTPATPQPTPATPQPTPATTAMPPSLPSGGGGPTSGGPAPSSNPRGGGGGEHRAHRSAERHAVCGRRLPGATNDEAPARVT